MIPAQPAVRENPYPGLRPFLEKDFHRFFGRDQQIDELLKRLSEGRFLCVTGLSGSGKSSLVRAGLIPALKRGYVIGSGSQWRIATCRPGDDPIGSLRKVLMEDAKCPSTAELDRRSLGLVHVAQNLRPDESLLIVIDQFEELFRYEGAEKRTEQGADFVSLLLSACSDKGVSVYVLLTMRSDFLGECARFQDLPEALNGGQYLVPRMTREQRQEAIERPLGRGTKMTPALVQQFLNDAGQEPNLLPVLQHALMRTWQQWSKDAADGPIDLRHYKAAGGFKDALNKHADEVYQSLEGAERWWIVQRLFRLITAEDSAGRVVRRPSRLDQVYAVTEASSNLDRQKMVHEVINKFREDGCNFLIKGDLKPESMIDISHESLCNLWGKLKEWVEDEAKSARWYRRVSESAESFKTTGGYCERLELNYILATYHPLDEGKRDGWNKPWSKRYNDKFDDIIRYLQESKKYHETLEWEDRQRQAKENKRKLRRILLWSGSILVVIMVGLIAIVFQQVARRSAAQTWAAQSKGWKNALGADSQDRAALLEIESHKTIPLEDNSDINDWESFDRLTKVDGSILLSDGNAPVPIRQVFAMSDGLHLIATTAKNVQRALVSRPKPNPDEGKDLIEDNNFIPSNTLINPSANIGVSTCNNGRSYVFALGDRAKHVLDFDCVGLIATVDRSGPGGPIAVLDGTHANRLRVFMEGGSTPIWTERAENSFQTFALSRDGRYLAFASDERVDRIIPIDLRTGTQLPDFKNTSPFLEFSPDSKFLAAGGRDGQVYLFNLEDRKLVDDRKNIRKAEGTITALAFSPDGQSLAYAADSKDITLRFIDLKKDEIRWSDYFGRPVEQIAFSPDGRHVALAVAENTARVLDASNGFETVRVTHPAKVNSVSFDVTGKNLISGSDDGYVRISAAENAKVEEHRLDCVGRKVVLGNQLGIANCSSSGKQPVRTCIFPLPGETASGEIPEDCFLAPSIDAISPAVDCAIGIAWTAARAAAGCASAVAVYNMDKGLRTTDPSFEKAFQEQWARKQVGVLDELGAPISITAIALSPDGKLLAFGDSAGRVAIFEEDASNNSWTKRWHCVGARKGENPAGTHGDCLVITDDHPHKNAPILSLSFSLDVQAPKLAVGNSEGDVWIVTRLKVDPKSVVFKHFHGEITALRFGKDSALLAYGSGAFAGVINALSGNQISSVSHDDKVVAVAFSPDERQVASADLAGKAMIVPLKPGRMEWALSQLLSNLGYGQPSPSGQKIITWQGTRNRTLRIYDLYFRDNGNLVLAGEARRAWTEHSNLSEKLALTSHRLEVDENFYKKVCRNLEFSDDLNALEDIRKTLCPSR